MCVLKEYDIFIDWSSWSIVGSIVLSKLWFECGLSSNQIRTNDVRNVVLLVVDSSSIHHYVLWVWPMLSPVHIIREFHLHGNLDELLLSPSTSFYLLQDLVGQQVSVGNFWNIFLMLAHEVFVWRKEWLPLIHVHLVKVAAVNLRKIVLFPLESSQVSHTCAKYTMVW